MSYLQVGQIPDNTTLVDSIVNWLNVAASLNTLVVFRVISSISPHDEQTKWACSDFTNSNTDFAFGILTSGFLLL